MNSIGDLQMQVNVVFFVLFLLVIFVVATLRLAFRSARQSKQATEQLMNKLRLLEEKVATLEGK